MDTPPAPAPTGRDPDADSGSTLPPLLVLIRGAWADPGGRPALLGGAACLGLLAALFWSPLQQLVFAWSTDDNYSHGFLVPPIALYFANEAARRGPIRARPGVAAGVALLAMAILGRLATVAIPVGIVADLSFVLGLAGLVSLLAGAGALGRFGFALGFLVFMIPLPVALYTTIASPLQLLVSKASAALLGATGIPVLREGNLLTLPGDVRMFVAEACSGMRQLTGFLALTTAVAYLTARPAWQRAALVASAVPVAMTANITRVTLTGWIMAYDPHLAMGTFHTVEGLLMMGFGLSLLAAECWALNALGQLLSAVAVAPEAVEAPPKRLAEPRPAKRGPRARTLPEAAR